MWRLGTPGAGHGSGGPPAWAEPSAGAGAGAGALQAQAHKAPRALQFSPARVLASGWYAPGWAGLSPLHVQRVSLNRRLRANRWHFAPADTLEGGTMGPGSLNFTRSPSLV